MDISEPVWGEALHQKLQKAAAAGFVTVENGAPSLHGTMGVRAQSRPGQDFVGLDYDDAKKSLYVLFSEQVFTTTLEDFASMTEDEAAPRAENAFHQRFIQNCQEVFAPRDSVRVPQMALNPVK